MYRSSWPVAPLAERPPPVPPPPLLRDPPSSEGSYGPLDRIEKIVSERMTQSFRDIPQFSVRFVADVEDLMARLPAMRESTGAVVTINDLILRAVAVALSRVPDVQYQFRPGRHLVSRRRWALDSRWRSAADLVVPVIRNADRKAIGEICRETSGLVERAKAHQLSADDVSGGTFTVSNLGMFGISSFVPIVNPGEGAILGVGAVQSVPRVRGGTVAAGMALELTLVCDHRSVNGATAARFCQALRSVLESPGESTW